MFQRCYCHWYDISDTEKQIWGWSWEDILSAASEHTSKLMLRLVIVQIPVFLFLLILFSWYLKKNKKEIFPINWLEMQWLAIAAVSHSIQNFELLPGRMGDLLRSDGSGSVSLFSPFWLVSLISCRVNQTRITTDPRHKKPNFIYFRMCKLGLRQEACLDLQINQFI